MVIMGISDGLAISHHCIYQLLILKPPLSLSFGHRVVAMASPGVATTKPSQTHPGTSERPPFFNGLNRVRGAGGGVAAIGSQHGGDGILVNFYRKNENSD